MVAISQGYRNVVTMLPVQSRMARAALGWGVRDLAKAAMTSPDTVARFERGEELKPRTVAALRAALESGGVVLLPRRSA
jgi:transcriptional regulator with XRE-family HTH domain